jgi:hypothetical protein
MKAIFAYNFHQPKMQNPGIEKHTFGGPNSAFTPYKVHAEVSLPEIRSRRKDAFRKLKNLFGISEPVCVASASKK